MMSSQIAHHRVNCNDDNVLWMQTAVIVSHHSMSLKTISVVDMLDNMWVKLWMKAWLGSYEGVHCKMAQVMWLICSMDGGGKHLPWEPMLSYCRWFPVLPELLGTLSLDCMYCRNCHSHPACTSALAQQAIAV